MARIRTVKPELFRHEPLFDLEQSTGLPIRLAWIGLFTVCDAEGRFPWRPRALKAEALPLDTVDFGAVLEALRTAGHVRRYEVGGDSFGYVPNWHKHQRITGKEREKGTKYPAPPTEEAPGKHPRNTRETPETHLDAQEQGTGNREEGAAASRAPSLPLPPPSEKISDLLPTEADTAVLDPARVTETIVSNAKPETEKIVSVTRKGEVAELAARTAPETDADLRRLPFGDPDILEFLETHNVPPKLAHGWVRAFSDDQPACESALRGVILKLLSNPNKLVELEVRKRPIAAYLTGAMTDIANGRVSTVMKPLRLAPHELLPSGPSPQSAREAERIAQDRRIAEEAAARIRDEDERARKAAEALSPEERQRNVKALVASIVGRRVTP